MPIAGNKITGSHKPDCPPPQVSQQSAPVLIQANSLDEKMDLFTRNLKLNQQDFDCIVTLMLKIIDGKCKMKTEEKKVIKSLYRCTVSAKTFSLNLDLQTLIDRSQQFIDEQTKLAVYEKRVLAETMISRPTMKAFKARIRQAGIYKLLGD